MVLYGVTIKHLQNIHKVMQSGDNTFISIIYLQIKSLYSSSWFKRCFLFAVCRIMYYMSYSHFNTYFIYISKNLQTNKGTNQELYTKFTTEQFNI